MTENVPAVPTTQTLITAEEELRVQTMIEELSAEQAQAEGQVLRFVHTLGKRLIEELQPTFGGNHASVGEYGTYAMDRIAEALGYDRSYLYLSMQFHHAFPAIVDRRSTMLTDGRETETPWSFRDIRLVLPLNDAQRAEAVDWYSHPWQEGDYLIPSSDVYPAGEPAPRHLYGTNKTRRDLELYVKFLRGHRALSAQPKAPSRLVQEQAREAASVFARYVARAPASTLTKLPVALQRVPVGSLTEGDREVLTASLPALIEQAHRLLAEMSRNETEALA